MGDESGDISINEAIFTLSHFFPEILTKFKVNHPEISDELIVGKPCGEEEKKQSNNQLYSKAKLICEALRFSSSKAKEGLSNVKSSLIKARRIRIIGQVMVLLGSSTILASIVTDQNEIEIASGIITFLAAVSSIFAEYFEKPLLPNSGNLYDEFQKLGCLIFESELNANEISILIELNSKETDIVKAIRKGNEQCRKMNQILVNLSGKVV